MAKFYDHAETGKLHFSSVAGGTGGGVTSIFDAPATAADIASHPREHGLYVKAKREAAAQAEAEAETAAEKTAVLQEVDKTAADVSEVLSHQAVPHGGATE